MIYFVVYMGDSPSLFFLKPCSPGNLPTRFYSLSMSRVPFAYLSCFGCCCCFLVFVVKNKPMHSMTSLLYDNWVFVQKWEQDCKAPKVERHGQAARQAARQAAWQAEPDLHRLGLWLLGSQNVSFGAIGLKSENNTFFLMRRKHTFS